MVANPLIAYVRQQQAGRLVNERPYVARVFEYWMSQVSALLPPESRKEVTDASVFDLEAIESTLHIPDPAFWTAPIVDHILAGMPAELTVDCTLLPERGFWWFEQPLVGPLTLEELDAVRRVADPSVAKGLSRIHGISWIVSSRKMAFYTSGQLGQQAVPSEAVVYHSNGPDARSVCSALIAAWVLREDDQPVPLYRLQLPAHATLRLSLGYFSQVYGQQFFPRRELPQRVLYLLTAGCEFMRQQRVDVTRHEVSAKPKKHRPKSPPPAVRVVSLRKAAPPPEPSQVGREYSCQWIVHEHTRMQPYGPGRKLRRPITVRSYTKGPKDKPLREETPVVYAVTR